jgi:hypothetical protein
MCRLSKNQIRTLSFSPVRERATDTKMSNFNVADHSATRFYGAAAGDIFLPFIIEKARQAGSSTARHKGITLVFCQKAKTPDLYDCIHKIPGFRCPPELSLRWW